MAFEAPRAADMFSDADSAKSAAISKEEFDSALRESMASSVSDPSAIMAIKSGQATFAQAAGNPVALLENLAINKSLSPEASASLQNALSSQRLAMQDIQKEITTTVPLSTSFAAFDLEAPAKMLTPRPTPLRNRIPRKKGVGTWYKGEYYLCLLLLLSV
jgi:hypothetical protein